MRPNVLNYACVGAAETGKLFYGSFSAKQNRCNGVNMKQEKRNENECTVRCSPQQVQAILEGLAAAHPDAKPELNFSNPFELLIATILSAQCTDKQVNKCTAQLFKAYPDAESMAAADEETLKKYIKPCGFFNTKAKHILSVSRDLTESITVLCRMTGRLCSRLRVWDEKQQVSCFQMRLMFRRLLLTRMCFASATVWDLPVRQTLKRPKNSSCNAYLRRNGQLHTIG